MMTTDAAHEIEFISVIVEFGKLPDGHAIDPPRAIYRTAVPT
jgi:hypothetical protein